MHNLRVRARKGRLAWVRRQLPYNHQSENHGDNSTYDTSHRDPVQVFGLLDHGS